MSGDNGLGEVRLIQRVMGLWSRWMPLAYTHDINCCLIYHYLSLAWQRGMVMVLKKVQEGSLLMWSSGCIVMLQVVLSTSLPWFGLVAIKLSSFNNYYLCLFVDVAFKLYCYPSITIIYVSYLLVRTHTHPRKKEIMQECLNQTEGGMPIYNNGRAIIRKKRAIQWCMAIEILHMTMEYSRPLGTNAMYFEYIFKDTYIGMSTETHQSIGSRLPQCTQI